MTDNWALQISPKLPDGTLINVRAETPDQLDNLLSYIENKGASIASAIASLTAGANVAGAFPGPGTQNVEPPAQQGWSQQPAQQGPPAWAGQQQAAPAQQDAAPAPQCLHGAMKFQTGTKNGKQWKAYFCPAPKGTPNQCEPQWIR